MLLVEKTREVGITDDFTPKDKPLQMNSCLVSFVPLYWVFYRLGIRIGVCFEICVWLCAQLTHMYVCGVALRRSALARICRAPTSADQSGGESEGECNNYQKGLYQYITLPSAVFITFSLIGIYQRHAVQYTHSTVSGHVYLMFVVCVCENKTGLCMQPHGVSQRTNDDS